MRSRFPSSWVDTVFSRCDIVDIVSGYLPLKRQGRNYVGLCPFHNEKTASFSVNRENNVYHCFGCKAGGSVVQFVMEMERLTYPDALLHLAKQLNIPAPIVEYNPQEEIARTMRERLHQANRDAALYFHDLLYQPQGRPMLEYLRDRGVEDALIRRFGLGASDVEWTTLMNVLLKKGYTQEELELAGLVHARDNNAYDAFRGRVMFPILDIYGNTLGFGARALGKEQPKYLNTQDTPVFNKRLGVYGINNLRKLRNLKRVILVEGYMDVIALSQHGVEGAVATLGTALTPQQARQIKKFAPEVWVAYDGDDAGQVATLKALGMLEQEMIMSRVLAFPDGLDPDDFLRQRGRLAFDNLQPVPAMRFRLERMKAEYSLQSDEGVSAYTIKACELLLSVPDPVEREQHLKRISADTGLTAEVLQQQMHHAALKNKGKSAAVSPMALVARRRADDKPDGQYAAEQTLLALLALGHLPKDMIAPEDFVFPLHHRLAQALKMGQRPAHILDEIDDVQERQQVSSIFGAVLEMTREQALPAAEECLKTMRLDRLSKQIEALRLTLDTAAQADGRKQALMNIMQLQEELNGLKSAAQTGKEMS